MIVPRQLTPSSPLRPLEVLNRFGLFELFSTRANVVERCGLNRDSARGVETSCEEA